MKLIPLTQGQFAKVDDEDFEWLMQWKWTAKLSSNGKGFYAKRNKKQKGHKQKAIYMAREILHCPDGVREDVR